MTTYFFEAVEEQNAAISETGIRTIFRDWRDGLVHAWLYRRHFKQLSKLSPEGLKDVGIDPLNLHAAAMKSADMAVGR